MMERRKYLPWTTVACTLLSVLLGAARVRADLKPGDVLIEKATGTWPQFGYGLAFAHIDPNDPQAAYKIMYNFFRTLGQADDINVFINFFWTTPHGLDRYVDFRGQALG